MNDLIKHFFCVVFFILSTHLAYGQFVANQGWVDYNPSFRLKSGLILFGDVGFRFLDVGQNLNNRINIRPGIAFKTKSEAVITAGVGYFRFTNRDILNANEVRLFGGFQFKALKLGRAKLDHYIRLEAKHVWFDENYLFPNVAFRFRYEIGEDVQLAWFNVNASDWYLPLAVEPFLDLVFRGDDFQWISKFRVTAGVGYVFNPKNSVELCYVFQETGTILERRIDVVNHAIRLRYYHKWN